MYGRDDVVRRLACAQPRGVVLAGDSGTGKSTVLSAAQACAGTAGIVAPAPVTIRTSPAALQLALLDAGGRRDPGVRPRPDHERGPAAGGPDQRRRRQRCHGRDRRVGVGTTGGRLLQVVDLPEDLPEVS